MWLGILCFEFKDVGLEPDKLSQSSLILAREAMNISLFLREMLPFFCQLETMIYSFWCQFLILWWCFCSMKTKYYQHVLALIFAIEEINKNSDLLPIVTLGFRIYDNLFSSKTTYETILDLLFQAKKKMPNYKCDRQLVLSVIGSFTVENSIQLATILSIYKISQVCAYVCNNILDS